VRNQDNPSPRRWLLDWLIGAGLFASSLLVYLDTLAPSVATIFDDSLEFQLVCYQPGIAHPTGYPLYTLLGKLFTFLPIGDVAYRVNLMSAVFASLSVALVYATLRLLVDRRVPAFLGAVTFAVSPVFWSQAIIAEVYTLNAAFVAITLLLLLAWARAQEDSASNEREVWANPTILLSFVAFVYGLSLTHHRTMLLLAPAAVISVASVDRHIFTSARLLAKLGLLILAPLVLYLYLPLRGMTMSSLNGVYENTLSGFLSYVAAGSYGIFLMENPLAQSRDLAFYGALLLDQFTWAGIFIAVLGLGYSFRSRKVALLLLLFAVTTALFALGYLVPDIEVFLIPLFLVCALWIGLGFDALWGLILMLWRRMLGEKNAVLCEGLYASLLVCGFLLPIFQWQANRDHVDLSQQWEVHDYGQDVLSQPLEENAVVVGILGEMTLLNYFQQTEGQRPDLTTIPADTEEERLAVVTAQMEEGHPVYLTRPLKGVEESYHLSSWGPLIHVQERPPAPPKEPSSALSTPFGEAIRLTGYDAVLRDTHLGPQLRVTLYWETLTTIAEDYKVSLRLLHDEGHLGAVRDAYPVLDAYRTDSWRPGEVIVDTHHLPLLAGLPPGDYTIQVTMYEPTTLAPLATSPIGTISLGSTLDVGRAGPWDVQHKLSYNLGGRIELLGYSVIGEGFKPGEPVPITLLWQGLDKQESNYTLLVSLEDEGGAKTSKTELPLSHRYPPALWQQREIVRDWQSFLLPGDTKDGRYHLKIQVLADGKALDRLLWVVPTSSVLDLGQIQVNGRERSFDVPPIARPLALQLGDSVKLLGYDLETEEARPGGRLFLTIYWQGLRTMDTSYTVFAHLLDSEGTIRGQRDGVPGQGTLPTTSWVEDEVIVDTYEIPIAPDAPPGTYDLITGMYDATTGVRLPVLDPEGQPVGDHIAVVQFELGAD